MTFSEEHIADIIAYECHDQNIHRSIIEEISSAAARKIKEEYYMEMLLATTCEHSQCKNAFRSASEECMNKHPYDVTITGKDLRILLNSLSHVKTERRVPGEMVDHTVAAMPAAAAKELSLSQPSGNASQNGTVSVREGLLVRNSLADAGEFSLWEHIEKAMTLLDKKNNTTQCVILFYSPMVIK